MSETIAPLSSLKESARALFANASNTERELRLITCDGVFDDDTQTYDKRLIVTAILKGDS